MTSKNRFRICHHEANMLSTSQTINKTEMFLAAGVLFLAALFVTSPAIHGNDGVGYFVYLASIFSDGDLDFQNQYQAYDQLKKYPYRFADLPRSPATGLPSNRYGIGAPLLWSPFVGVGRIFSGNLEDWYSDDGHRIDAKGVGYATAFWGSLGLLLIYRRLRQNATIFACGLTVGGLILATPLGFYIYAHGSMAHGVSFCLLALSMLEFEKAWKRPDPINLSRCGIWLSLALMTRYQDLTWVLTLGGALLYRIHGSGLHDNKYPGKSDSIRVRPGEGRNRLKIQHTTCLILPALVIFIPQLACWKVLYGSWFSGPTPYLSNSHGYFSHGPVHALQVLFSERGGVLAWHPLILCGLVGMVIWRRTIFDDPMIFRIIMAGLTLQWILVSCWSIWWGGASFGNRFFISSLPFIALGIAPWINSGRKRLKISAVIGMAMLIVWNLGLLIQYSTKMVPREDPVPWTRVIRQNLVDVPALLLEIFLHGRE